jgi:hypothetical protein
MLTLGITLLLVHELELHTDSQIPCWCLAQDKTA